MKLQKLILAGAFGICTGLASHAQIIENSTANELALWGAPNSTGLAVIPGSMDIQAAVFDDGSGDYYIQWIESTSSTVVDADQQPGTDPDVAYYANEDLVTVVYENGGNVFIDEYFLTSLSPLDYVLGNTIYVGNGEYPNIDMASTGYGIVTWENGGDVFVSTYTPGTVGPMVWAGGGTQPDVVVTDNYDLAALTYVDPAGELMIETISYFNLFSSSYSIVTSWGPYTPSNFYEYPRIAAERNQFFGGNLENFTVTVQDYGSSSPIVEGFFVTNGSTMNPAVIVNPDFLSCGGDMPLPVVAYERGRVKIAWSQEYPGTCSGLSQSNPNASHNDVFVRMFNPTGTISGDYLEANQWQSTFAPVSRHSLASRYDGVYGVNNSNFQSGILFNDVGDLFWKGIYPGNSVYMDEAGISAEREGSTFSLVTSPVAQTIEVLSETDDVASFQLLDNAGRIVELRDITSNDNVYSIDITHLSGGMYFLNCSSASGQEVLRVLQCK